MTVADEVGAEVARQYRRWGTNDELADGRPVTYWIGPADMARAMCDDAHADGVCSWAHVLVEECAEAVEEATAGNVPALRAELVQVAAVAQRWIETIDRRIP